MSTGAGSFELGGDLAVDRLGFGAMRISRSATPPEKRRAAHALLRRTLELGVTLIDTADAYGPEVSEELIAEALHPYPDELVIATKGGLVPRSGGQADCRPERLRACCEASLRRLELERIDLYQLHLVDPDVPLEDSVGALAELRAEGKIRHVGLSNVNVDELARARAIAPVVSVQNRYNLADRASEDVLEACEADGIAFLPYFPLATGTLTEPGGPLARAAERHGAAPSQVALAWLLQRSPVMLPIPGTSSIDHLEENVAAARLRLEPEELEELAAAAAGT